jgi:hypothetical protein
LKLLRLHVGWFVVIALVLLPGRGELFAAETSSEFFEKRIRPILVERCYECHATGKKTKGGLALDTAAATLKGGDSGPAILPGNVRDSLLIKAVRYSEENLQMPPKHRLDAAEVELLERWVATGAPDPRTNSAPKGAPSLEHWSLQPLGNPPVPKPRNSRWPNNEIDRFVLATLEARGLTPSPPADRRTLIRRTTFDLLGLPPSPEEIAAFLQDREPGAFERVIERLLSSPHYGERWGRHWLDLVRYADTAGDSADYPIPQAYRYRNYVIDAFNADKPYDQFLCEQIAGDLMPAASPEKKREQTIATGFLAVARRFSVEPSNTMHLTIEDTLDTIGRSVLGLSLSCARCHDHKYDPVTMQDYYAMYGILSSTRFPYPGSENQKKQANFVPLYSEVERESRHLPEKRQYQELDDEVIRMEKRMAFLEREGLKDEELRRELSAVRQRRNDILARALLEDDAYAVAEGVPGSARIQLRGDPANASDEVPRGLLPAVGGGPLSSESGSGRMQMAAWLADSRNPLTARVMVNRIWQHHFGAGLVRSASDFGARGRQPTHPELLDYLARRFVSAGWSVKSMHRLIMTSRTYQQASADDAGKLAADPDNEWLCRFSRRRLDAESLRDTLLEVSGTLERARGGMHPFPLPNRWDYTQHDQFTGVYGTRKRSVYLMQQRIRKHPFLATFDGPDGNASMAERPVTITPLQALFALNDVSVFEQAASFANRLLSEEDDASRVQKIYQLCYGRAASGEEVRAALNYVHRTCATQTSDTRLDAWASLARAVFASNEFMFVD